MPAETYINRILHLAEEDQTISETELFEKSGIFIVLAEPGGGKTELLKSLAGRFGIEPIRASIFRHKTPVTPADSLVLDALDEVAKIDQSAIDCVDFCDPTDFSSQHNTKETKS